MTSTYRPTYVPSRTIRKPGTALRATVAFGLLNLPLVITTGFVYLLSGGETAEWWVRGILAIGVAVAEYTIVITTIGPPLYDWIRSEEFVKEGSKPSWEKE